MGRGHRDRVRGRVRCASGAGGLVVSGDGWISVADRLPDPGARVLIGWAGLDEMWIAFLADAGFGDGEGYEYEPTHWMPLPEPPT